MLRRDLPTLAIGRTTLVNADPNKPAVFSLFLGNASESNETRRYILRSVNERNPNGAVMKVNGAPIHEGVVFTLAPGKQIEATLSVERGPTRFRYDSLQVILYPECAGLPSRISEKEGAAQTFSVSFKSVSSPITLYTSPRFDLDFGALPDAALGDSLALADFTLETIDYGDPATTADDVYLTDVGMEYRPATSAVWTTAFTATRAQIIAASPQSANATTYYTRWKPKTSDVDGAYVFRAYTRSTGGGPSGAFYYGETMPGRIDRKAPLVFGTPQPASEVLALGADVSITFDEAVAPSSVRADSSVAGAGIGQPAARLRRRRRVRAAHPRPRGRERRVGRDDAGRRLGGPRRSPASRRASRADGRRADRGAAHRRDRQRPRGGRSRGRSPCAGACSRGARPSSPRMSRAASRPA